VCSDGELVAGQAGIKGTGSNVATSLGNYGTAVQPGDVQKGDVQKGDVLVHMNGRRVGETGGHVGFATGNVDPKTGKVENVLRQQVVWFNDLGKIPAV
jgi:hypothetical protein